jgi:hypothetical protein
MSTSASTTSGSSTGSKIAWGLVLIAGFYFLLTRAFPYFNISESIYGNYWPIRWWVLGHVAGGVTALVLGPSNFGKDLEINIYICIEI